MLRKLKTDQKRISETFDATAEFIDGHQNSLLAKPKCSGGLSDGVYKIYASLIFFRFPYFFSYFRSIKLIIFLLARAHMGQYTTSQSTYRYGPLNKCIEWN